MEYLNKIYKYIVLILILNIQLLATNHITKYFEPDNRDYYQKVYGKSFNLRIDNIIKELQKAHKQSTLKKLQSINNLFNKFTYLSDKKTWKSSDYWSTPFEFIGIKAGDSEDFALIKYIALISVGIKKEKLKLMRYKNKRNRLDRSNEYIVLAYFHKKNSIPIILDKVNKKLKRVPSIQLTDAKLSYDDDYWNNFFTFKKFN